MQMQAAIRKRAMTGIVTLSPLMMVEETEEVTAGGLTAVADF